MKALQEIRERLEATSDDPWKTDGVGGLYMNGTGGQILGQYAAQNAEFIAHAPTDVARLLAAVEGVLGMHKPRTEEVITGDCAEEACGHEESDDCPRTPFEACAGCWSVAEDADAYFSEGGVSIVAYPCPTVKAITAALADEPSDTNWGDQAGAVL